MCYLTGLQMFYDKFCSPDEVDKTRKLVTQNWSQLGHRKDVFIYN